MISKRMERLINNNSVIREMFEEGKKLKLKYGEENVFDFSIGNPSIEPPTQVNEAIKKSLNIKNIHNYMNNSGYENVRKIIADYLNIKFNTDYNENNIVMSVGAAGGLNVTLQSLLNDNDEVIVFVPYFMEYKNYIENFHGKVVEVSCNENFEPDLKDFEQKINPNTKAVIVNSPNNPSGIIYSENTIIELTNILKKKEEEFNNTIYLISDEPYREIVFDGIEVPYLTHYYNDTIVVYCYSKSLSLPGERIGFISVPNKAHDYEKLIQALSISTRILGFVNAPALIQKSIAECVNLTCDMSEYEKNRNILYEGLVNCGYECIKPQGTFYLFLKSPIEDEKEFCKIAKEYNILVVPGSSFAKPGYVRIAFCTKTTTVENSIPKFKELMDFISNR